MINKLGQSTNQINHLDSLKELQQINQDHLLPLRQESATYGFFRAR
ncbi:MAG: hypothetical protein ACTMUB_05065 [cyanobacterium endosymbiont of Rhopalodia musculus]|nr:hypothetical protein [cyanobacterium endosymbiont of Epithemia clementina EcSB]WGT67525.1 hypothetical protein P3F56_10150 [cyanobacterium endosymbiont of Epithemia clementina EcSB]